MKLSEAIREGSKLRPETHNERFAQIENLGVLGSDVWGAACEAVQPKVAKLNWNPRDRYKFESAMTTLRAIQDQYFGVYFNLPAQCPVAIQRFQKAGGRVINRKGEIRIEGTKDVDIGGVTSECDKVKTLAGFIDHAFYAHGWTREQCAEAARWYEEKRFAAGIAHNFAHYQVN